MIQVESLSKHYAARYLFRDLSWHIGREDRVGLVGPNGAGKTTLLRILAGEEGSDEGVIRRPRSVAVGYLAQEIVTVEEGSILSRVLDAHEEIRGIEEELEELHHRVSAASDERQERLLARYGDLQHRYEALGGYELEAEARRILTGLGFSESQMHRPLSSLSGGFRMRVILARLLLTRPELLLLDEPTNHLDLESLAWLEEFMTTYTGAIVVASHDRVFLNRVVTGIAELEDGRFTLYPGNYDEYLEIRALRREQEEARAAQQARRVAEIEKFIERFRAKATKARQVQSRIKMLDRMERIEVRRTRRRVMRLKFPTPPRGGAVSIEMRGLVKRYGEKTVYEGVDFTARRGERIALIGPNGAGKTTLLRILADALPFEGGERVVGHNVSIAYYAQHQLENLDPANTILDEVAATAPDEVRPRLRGLLGSFLFSGDDVDKKVAVLSGGEKARVALCKMLLHPANLLLLDEPTNHLDLRSREVLEDALDDYEGTIIFISHDRYFIDRIAERLCEVRDGRFEWHLLSYAELMRSRSEEVAGRESSAAAEPESVAEPEKAAERRAGKPGRETAGEGGTGRGGRKRQAGARERRRTEAEERRRREQALKPLKEKLQGLESEIQRDEQRLQEVMTLQTDPSVWADGERAKDAEKERRALEERLAWLYDEWTQVSERMEP